MRPGFVYAVVFLQALTAAYACWCWAPLIWDGAYQFNATLILQWPYFYLTRFHTYLLWWPTVWASRHTTNMLLLQSLYGLPFLLAPLVAVAGSWWMVRKPAPHLILWVLFGVAAGTLPGQIFVINDSIFQLHLFWPILTGMLVPLTWPKRIAIGGLAVFQFVHQLGCVLALGAAVGLLLGAWLNGPDRARYLRRAGAMALLFALTAGKIYATEHLFPDPRTGRPRFVDTYAAEEATWDIALDRWRDGVKGWPLAGLSFMWLAALAALRHRQLALGADDPSSRAPDIAPVDEQIVDEQIAHGCTSGGRSKVRAPFVERPFVEPAAGRGQPFPGTPDARKIRRFAVASLLLLGMGAVCFIIWAGDAHAWWKALDYRRWVGPLTAPFLVLATLEGGARPRKAMAAQPLPNTPDLSPGVREVGMLREWLVLVLGAVFAIVLGVQCHVWSRLTTRLEQAFWSYRDPVPAISTADLSVDRAVIVPEAQVRWLEAGTPLDHWATADFLIARQGKQPRRLMLSPHSEELLVTQGKVPHWDFYPNPPDPTPAPPGWFDYSQVLARTRHRSLTAIPGPQRMDARTTPN